MRKIIIYYFLFGFTLVNGQNLYPDVEINLQREIEDLNTKYCQLYSESIGLFFNEIDSIDYEFEEVKFLYRFFIDENCFSKFDKSNNSHSLNNCTYIDTLVESLSVVIKTKNDCYYSSIFDIQKDELVVFLVEITTFCKFPIFIEGKTKSRNYCENFWEQEYFLYMAYSNFILSDNKVVFQDGFGNYSLDSMNFEYLGGAFIKIF